MGDRLLWGALESEDHGYPTSPRGSEMTEIDRRSLIGIAGAGLVLSGCGRVIGNNTNSSQLKSEDLLAACEDYGQLVGDKEPSVIKQGSKQFVPQFVCGVYMKFHQDRLSVRHAYVGVPTDSTKEVWYSKGKALLKAIASNNYKNSGVIRIEDNFNKFGFNSAQLIMFFIDNDPQDIDFDNTHANPNGLRAEDHIIRFTPRGSKQPEAVRQRNHAFLNLHPVNYTNLDSEEWPYSNKGGYALEYWNIDHSGKYIDYVSEKNDNSYYLYSMNIHLKVTPVTLSAPTEGPMPSPTPATAFVPMILDPDTGNMGGGP